MSIFSGIPNRRAPLPVANASHDLLSTADEARSAESGGRKARTDSSKLGGSCTIDVGP